MGNSLKTSGFVSGISTISSISNNWTPSTCISGNNNVKFSDGMCISNITNLSEASSICQNELVGCVAFDINNNGTIFYKISENPSPSSNIEATGTGYFFTETISYITLTVIFSVIILILLIFMIVLIITLKSHYRSSLNELKN